MLLSGAFRFTFQATVILALFWHLRPSAHCAAAFFMAPSAPLPVELQIFSFTDNVSPLGVFNSSMHTIPIGFQYAVQIFLCTSPAASSVSQLAAFFLGALSCSGAYDILS